MKLRCRLFNKPILAIGVMLLMRKPKNMAFIRWFEPILNMIRVLDFGNLGPNQWYLISNFMKCVAEF